MVYMLATGARILSQGKLYALCAEYAMVAVVLGSSGGGFVGCGLWVVVCICFFLSTRHSSAAEVCASANCRIAFTRAPCTSSVARPQLAAHGTRKYATYDVRELGRTRGPGCKCLWNVS